MLDLARYLLGVFEVVLLAGFAALGATALRRRLLPSFTGAPAHLTTAVIALALLIWVAESLGSVGLFEPLPYLLAVGLVGVVIWALLRRVARGEGVFGRARPLTPPRPATGPAGRGGHIPTLIGLAIGVAVLIKFGLGAKPELTTGMTGFDSTWYHGPFAAGFFQSGSTWELHLIAPRFLAWFYPANAEIFHAAGLLAFNRDFLSPLLNIGWFVGCLVACWCIGRPYGVAPWSLGLGAIALSLPVLTDQAGEARNDIVGIFFLLAAVAVLLNASTGRRADPGLGGAVVVGLAAGLAAGTKLNFLLPAAVLVLGLALIAPAGRRWRALAVAGLAALAGGGYWYLRNLIHTGNPLPWFDSVGPISLPAPDQALGGREGHTVLGYLTDGAVWSDWFLPGLHEGLTVLWPLLAALALAGLLLSLLPSRGSLVTKYANKEPRDEKGNCGAALWIAGLTGLAALLAWLMVPTSASGPEGMPRGFESGLRYLVPALALGLAVLPVALLPRVARHMGEGRRDRTRGRLVVAGLACLVAVIAIGYPLQRHYLSDRYADPSFAAPGLNAAFAWAAPRSGARIATTSTRQYPLYGTDLTNRVEFVGERRPHGGFLAPTTCPQWRRLLNAGNYDYAITTRDRIEPDKSPYPATARWTEAPNATVVLRTPPTVVFKLSGKLPPSSCAGRAGS